MRYPGLWLLLLLAVPVTVRAQPTSWSVGLGFEFSSGDYGTDLTTDVVRIPLIVKAYPTERLDFQLEIPYLMQNNSATVNLGGGRVPMSSRRQATATGSRRRSVDIDDSQSGLGDIDLTAGWVLLQEGEYRPLVRPLAYAKFPTADEDQGLGTGEFDFGGGLSLAKWFGDWSTYVEGMYLVPGDSAEFEADDYWSYLVSLGYLWNNNFKPGLTLSGATAPSDAAEDALEVQVRLSWWPTEQGSLSTYVSRGLEDGSPDYTIGLFGSIGF